MYVRVFNEHKKLIGNSYGFLTILDIKYESKRYISVCKCICGEVKDIRLHGILSGRVKSCGCMADVMRASKSKSHGKSSTLEYSRWISMKARCGSSEIAIKNNPHHAGKGITVCDEWMDSFENFLSDMGHCPEGFTLDRIDSDLGYFKDNCRWVSYSTQLYNRDFGKQAGVNYIESRGKWKSEIRVNGVNVFLGYFEHKDDAISARLAAEIKYFGEHPSDGKYV